MKNKGFKRFAFSLFLACLGGSLWAQIPTGYYNSATGKTGDELKVALHNVIKDHHVVSYAGLLNAYAYTDCDANGKIWDIYSNYHFDLNGTCGEYTMEGDCWNREHTWPQSWFNESTTPRSDLFHVYPTDGYVNNRRSSYPYGEVSHPTYTSGNGSKLGPCVTSGYSGTVFEPVDEYKGDIARSYFYMSVRYYSEDDSWSTSGMTNKSEILPWAMTMLLRWSDQDPVSEKEIARNNAVYGYQNNRNPFIDHPEYARMIWDENWSGGISYNITCATGLQHGSVSAPENAMEGSTVAITATPELGYMVGSYSVYKTDTPSIIVSVSGNGTFTMPGFAVTISASFVQNDTYYTITLGNVSHGSISASVTNAMSGTTISLTATPDNGYSLYSWYVFKTGDMNTTASVNGNSFVMPAFDVTVMATFVQGSANGDFVKVTTDPTDWSGDYVLVYEQSNTTGYVWTGVDAQNCFVEKTINDNTIANDDMVSITVAPMTGGYSIKVNGGPNNGKYIYGTSGSNKINFGNTASVNTLACETTGVTMTSNTSVMRYNTSENRFRYYKSTTFSQQQPVQLYKRVHATQTHTIHFDSNGGEGTMNDQVVNEFEPTDLQANAFVREGFVFEGWNTAVDGTGDFYADGAPVTLLGDLTLYAQWDQLFNITLVQTNHGSISASASQAFEGTEIILAANPDPCYALTQWVVTDTQGNAVTVIESQFEMPDDDVSVSAVFTYSPQSFVQEYQLVTSADQLVAGRTYLIVNVTNGKALGTTQNNNNRSASPVTIEDGVISVIDNTICELVLGAAGNNWTFFDPDYGTNGGYLYAASSSNNYLRTQASNNANGQWSISINAEGLATLQAQGNNTRNLLKYNSSSDVFSCYASGSTQLDVCLFRRTEINDYPAEQTFELTEGWNWWSASIGITLQQLEEALGTTSYRILSQDGKFVTYSINGTWSGTLHSIELGKMYKIQSNESCTITVSGFAVSPADCPISLFKGNNWIGFIGGESMTLDQAFSSFTPTDMDVIKSANGKATYYQGYGWRGRLSTLEPGRGYIYKSNAANTRTFYFPTR